MPAEAVYLQDVGTMLFALSWVSENKRESELTVHEILAFSQEF